LILFILLLALVKQEIESQWLCQRNERNPLALIVRVCYALIFPRKLQLVGFY